MNDSDRSDCSRGAKCPRTLAPREPHALLCPRGPAGACLRAMAPLALALALLGACASSDRSYVDSKVEGAEVDYRARHERMLQLVLLRPAVLEAQRQERERRERELNVEQWDVVMARNEAFVQQRRDTRARDAQAFERLLARQRELNAGRESARTERWAQFLEKGGAGQSGAATPPAGGGTP